ncbi:MAG: hypothetical protein KAQ83_02580 [Nanoarchaeota archaeon]|nr:hypothetical protein [Nanoarchaeota archaeon]
MEDNQNFEDLGADEEVYSKEGRDHLVEDDEISPWEAAFMEGADEDGTGAKCRTCGKILLREKAVIEKVINGELHRFCSDECLDSFEKEN